MAQVKTYDGRTISVPDPQFRYPVDYIGITRGLTAHNHGGADFGWNGNYGGPNHVLKTPGKVNRVRTVHDNGLYNGGYGNYITMDCDGFVVLFGHCQRGSFKVKPGDVLPQGVEVCKMNNSGNSTGSHLHFEIYAPSSTANKDRVDPLALTYIYPGQIVSPNTACREQIKYYAADTPTTSTKLSVVTIGPMSAGDVKNVISLVEPLVESLGVKATVVGVQ